MSPTDKKLLAIAREYRSATMYIFPNREQFLAIMGAAYRLGQQNMRERAEAVALTSKGYPSDVSEEISKLGTEP